MEIIYVMDPLCGWCYGNSQTINQIYDKYKDGVSFNVMPGGMWVGGNASLNNPELAAFIRRHDQVVKRRTGAKFGPKYQENILDNPSHVFNSEPPSRAIVAVSQLKPEAAFVFAGDVLRLQFWEGKDLNDGEVYLDVIGRYDISQDRFARLYESERLARDTQTVFDMVRQIGVTGFPTLLASYNGRREILATGYMPFASLDQIVKGTLNL